MSLTFILILLLVIGIVFANIALLRFNSKPMPQKSKSTAMPTDTSAAPAKTQAAATTALPITTSSTADTQKPSAAPDKAPSVDGSDSGAGGD